MSSISENETWIINAGDEVIQKKARSGSDSLTDVEKLIYSLWVTDYGMRNAGDLGVSRDIYDNFQRDAARIAKQLDLEITQHTFADSQQALERIYFEQFDQICTEIRSIGESKV